MGEYAFLRCVFARNSNKYIHDAAGLSSDPGQLAARVVPKGETPAPTLVFELAVPIPVGAAISRPQMCADEKRAADSRPYGMTGVIPSCSCPRGIYYLSFFQKEFLIDNGASLAYNNNEERTTHTVSSSCYG